MSQARTPRGSRDVADLRRRKRLFAILAACGVVLAAVAIAFAVNRETCDIETRIPEERELICALRDGGDVPACPSTGLSREECEAILAEFDTEHGRG